MFTSKVVPPSQSLSFPESVTSPWPWIEVTVNFMVFSSSSDMSTCNSLNDENTANASEDSQNLPPRQDCSSLVWGNIAGCPCDFESPKTLEGCDSVSCSKSIVLIFWHCQKLKTQDKIEFDKIEVWQLSHFFFRCQMSDDFSERGHMVNSIFGLYIMWTSKYLYHISEGLFL